MSYNNPRRWHFILFIILSVVAIAQLSWWVIFQVQEGNRLIQEQMMIWGQQLNAARLYLQTSDMDTIGQQQWLEKSFPDLEFTENHDDIVVTAGAMNDLERQAKKHVRMFVSEGAFFSLLVLAGIWFLYWALRERLQIERRTDQILAAASEELSEPLSSLSQLISNPSFLKEQHDLHVKWLGKMANNIQLISGALNNMHMARLMTISKRRIPLKLVDLSAETEVILENYDRIMKALRFEIEPKIVPGLSLVTNLERWELIVRGLIEIAMRIPAKEKRLEISLTERREVACFEIKRFLGEFGESEDLENNAGRAKYEASKSIPGLEIVRNLAETINGRLEVSYVDDGKTIILSIEFPRLYDGN